MPMNLSERVFRSHRATRHGMSLFARNTAASTLSFAFDLALLPYFKEVAGITDLVAVTIAFLMAMTLHYVIARLWVFRGTERGVASGYAYFLNAVVGLSVTLTLFWLLSRLPGLHYLASRALASVVAGVVVFFLNAVFNFRQLGPARGRADGRP